MPKNSANSAAEPAQPEQPETTAGADEATADEQPVFENRAARRAKGRGRSEQVSGHDQPFRRHGTAVQGPRQYGRRRSG